MKPLRILQIFFLSFLPVLAYTAPVISNVQILQKDSYDEITINGSNFGPKPNVILFDTFSGGKEGDSIPMSSPEVGSWSGNGGWAGKARFSKGENGNMGHGVRDFSYSTSSMNRIAQLDKDLGGDQKEIYISYEVYVPVGNFFSGASSDYTLPQASSWKFVWLTDNEGVQTDGLYDMCIPTQVGYGTFTIAGNEGGIDKAYGVVTKNWWAWHKTNRMSFWQKAVNDYGSYIFYAVNESGGFTTKSANNKQLMFSTSTFNNIRFPGWFGNGDQSNFNAVYDNMYIAVGANSQARVELSNSKIYEDSTFLKIFPPSAWSTGKIVLPLYGLTKDINSLYLHITDANGNRNPGINIGTLLTGTPTPLLSPPNPMTIQ